MTTSEVDDVLIHNFSHTPKLNYNPSSPMNSTVGIVLYVELRGKHLHKNDAPDHNDDEYGFNWGNKAQRTALAKLVNCSLCR